MKAQRGDVPACSYTVPESEPSLRVISSAVAPGSVMWAYSSIIWTQNPILWIWLCLLAWDSALWVIPFFFFKGKVAHVCSWVVLLACFLPGEFWGVWQSSFILYSVSFLVQLAMFLLFQSFQEPMDLLCTSWGSTPLDKRFLRRYFLDNPISTFGSYWDGSRAMPPAVLSGSI